MERSSTKVNERWWLFSLSVAARAEEKGKCLENPLKFLEKPNIKGCGSAVLLSNPGNPPEVQHHWTRTFSVCKQELWTSLVYTNRRMWKYPKPANWAVRAALKWNNADKGVGIEVWEQQEWLVQQARLAFPKSRAGGWCEGGGFLPTCLNTYFQLLSCHKRNNLFNFTKCYWSCWKWSCSPRLLNKWVCVFLEGS